MSTETEYTVTEAVQALEARTGQAYVTSEWAYDVLFSIAERVGVDQEWCERHDYDDCNLALQEAIADVQRRADEARGITTAKLFETILTASDASAIAVEMLGGEPSDASMLGAGSTEDVRHEENMEALDSLLDQATGDGAVGAQ